MENNTEQLESIFEAILSIAQFDYQNKALVGDDGNHLDAIAAGINMLSEEMEAMAISKAILEQSEEKFRILAESISDPYFAMDNDLRYLYWNNASEKLTGINSEDAIGKSLYELFPNIKGSVIEDHYNEVLFSKKAKTITDHYNLNNIDYYFELSIYPTTNGLSVISKDVTDKINAENKIKELNENLEQKVIERTQKIQEYGSKFKLAQQASGIAIWDWDLLSGKRELDDASYSLYGETRESWDGGYDTWRLKVHKDDITRIELETKNAIENLSQFESEFRIIWPSGEIRHLKTHVLVFRDENNKATRVLGTNLDITEYKVAEQKLKISEEAHRNLFETMSQGVTYQDFEGKILSANAAAEKLLGLSIEQMTGRKSIDPRWKCIHADGSDFPGNTHPSMVALETGKEVKDVIMGVFNPKIEAYTWINVNAVPQFTTGEKKPSKVYVTFEDITQRKLQEDLLETQAIELQQANKELQAYSYSVTHDLKAPLRSLEGFSEALLDKYKGKFDDDADRWLNFISTNAKKMNSLINDILEYSKVSKNSFLKNKVSMNLLVQECFENEKNNYSNKELNIDIEILPEVFGDVKMLRQVWQNLISNAFKYSSRNENINITVSGTVKNDFYIYSIKDNGVGFDEKYMEKLFGVFQRLHSSNEFEGSGVGLAIVKRILERHDGWVLAKSELGKGSEFSFGLPVNKIN